MRGVLPSVAEATALKKFVPPTLELYLPGTTEQTGLIGAAFGIEAPLKFAMQIREATVLKRAEPIGDGILELLLDDRVDVEEIRQEIARGREGEGFIFDLLKEASDIKAATEPRAFVVDKIPVLDALLERVESAMESGDAALREKKARAVLLACAGTGQGYRGGDGCQYEFIDIHKLPRRQNAALGVASACLAVLLHAHAVDRDVANALLASICASGWDSMLMPSAKRYEKLEVGASLLQFMSMMPERGTGSSAIQAYMMRVAARNLTCVQLTEEAERLLDEAIERESYDPMRRVRESELDRAAGRMSVTNDDDDRNDTTYEYESEDEDDNPFLGRKDKFKTKKKQAARMPPEVAPEKADLRFVAGLATMPLDPVTTKAPPPYDLDAEFAKLFHAPKRRAGAYGDKKKSPAKPREDPTKKAKDDNRFSILNERVGGGDGDADTAAARGLFS